MGGRSVARKVLEHIKNSGKYYDVTGNTRGSIAWGIYYDGVLHEISTPYKRIYVRRRTLVKGERDFETGFVARTGDVHYYGYEASEEFLKDYKPSSKGLSVVFVVGTHYAEYIENVRKLNVMTDSVYFVRAAGSGLIKVRSISKAREDYLLKFKYRHEPCYPISYSRSVARGVHADERRFSECFS